MESGFVKSNNTTGTGFRLIDKYSISFMDSYENCYLFLSFHLLGSDRFQ